MTDLEADCDGDLAGLSRRAVLQTLAMGAATGTSAAGVADAALTGGDGAVLADPDDLGSWVVMRNHEVPVYRDVGSSTPVANVDGRAVVRTTYGLSHVNTKVPDGSGDVARPECGGQPGVQHRFVATTFSMGRVTGEDGTYPVKLLDGLSLEVEGPGSNCGPVSFALNNSFQHRTSTAAFEGSGSSDFDEYTGDELRSKVQGQIDDTDVNADPARPTEPKPAKEAAELVFNTGLVLAATATGPIGAAAIGLAQPLVVNGLVNLLFESCNYQPNQRLEDGSVLLNQDQLDCASAGGSGDGGPRYPMTTGSAAFNMVDFTVTVPPRVHEKFSVDHNVEYKPMDSNASLGVLTPDNTRTVGDVSIGDGTDTGEHMRGHHSWTVNVPGIELGTSTDDLGSGLLPSPSGNYQDGPEPSIELAEASFDDLAENDTVKFEAAGVDDPEDARWRLYRRNDGPNRSAIDYGTEFTWRFDQASKFPSDTLDDPTFGAGEYTVEFIAFGENVFGSAKREFSVERAIEDVVKIYAEGTDPRDDTKWTSKTGDGGGYNGVVTLSAQAGRPDQLGRTVTLNATDSDDPYTPRSQSTGIDLYVWQIERPSKEKTRWVWEREGKLDLDIEHSGEYVVELTVFSFENAVYDGLEDVDDDQSPDLLNEDGTPTLKSVSTDSGTLERLQSWVDEDTVSGAYANGSIILDQNAPPEPSLEAPETVREGKTARFDASGSTDPDGAVETYTWGFVEPKFVDQEDPPESLDDLAEDAQLSVPDGSADKEILERRFEKSGIWAVVLQVVDDSDAKKTAFATVEVESDLAPGITVSSKTVAAGSPIRFRGQAGEQQNPLELTWEWTFDGPYGPDTRAQPTTETDSGPTVEHTFAEPGTYTVTLAVTGNTTKRTSIEVTVEPSIDPQIEVLSDRITVAAPARFEATSDLPVGAVDWEWFVQDVDDPLANPNETGTVEATGRVVDIDFQAAGEYEVVARGHRDALVATASTTVTVSPSGVNAVAERVGSDSLYVDPEREVLFTAKDSYDTDGEIATYTWYVDGKQVEQGPNAVQLSYEFASEGSESKRVSVVVEDDAGNSDRDDVPIVVFSEEERRGPEAELRTVAPNTSPVPPQATVQFSAADSTDPNGDIRDYVWSVDGEVVRRAGRNDAFDERKPPERFEYSFAAPSDGDTADHSVSVLVRDAKGFGDTAETTVTVGTAGDGGDGNDGAGTDVIKRDRSDGTVYQTGTLTSKPDSVSGASTVSVTGKVEAKTDGAESNVIYGVLGFDDGTILDVTRMSGLGTGTVTNEATVPAQTSKRTVVWSFYAASTASAAETAFGNEADRDALANGPYGIVVGVVDGSASPDGFTDGFDYPSSQLSANGWTTRQGSMVVSGSKLQPSAGTYKSEVTHPQGLATGTFEFSGVQNAASFYGLKVGIIADSTEFTQFAGYRVIWTQTRNGDVRLQRINANNATDLLKLTDDHGGAVHDVRIERSLREDGEYEFVCYYDGSKVGTVVDSTYTSSSHFVARFDGVDMGIDAVKIKK